MAKIVIDIPLKQLEEIDRLISLGIYQNYSNFYNIAGENQLIIEKEDARSGTYYPEDRGSLAFRLPFSIENFSILFEIPEWNKIKSPTVNKEGEDWLWGQINRIFPVKVALRVLIIEIVKNNSPIEIDEFYEKACEKGLMLYNHLARVGEKSKKRRDDRLNVGLPKNQKGFARYQNHFIGSIRKDSKLDGAIFKLKFANLINNCIAPTKQGFLFAKLENPCLDTSNPMSVFSDKEVKFLLSHIINFLPSEKQTYKLIIGLILNGKSSPSKINEEIRKYHEEWSDPVVNTMRSGAMSRMYELGLLRKEKTGVQVKYCVTNLGKEFLRKVD